MFQNMLYHILKIQFLVITVTITCPICYKKTNSSSTDLVDQTLSHCIYPGVGLTCDMNIFILKLSICLILVPIHVNINVKTENKTNIM